MEQGAWSEQDQPNRVSMSPDAFIRATRSGDSRVTHLQQEHKVVRRVFVCAAFESEARKVA